MRISEADILFIPGLGGSGRDHWQTRWADKMATGRTVDLPNPGQPSCDHWTKAINAEIAACENPVLLVAHSLGSLAVAHAMQSFPAPGSQGDRHPVSGAFLVAPPSARALETLGAIDPAFAPPPSAPLPFPALVIASSDDPYATTDETENMALDWGAQVVDAGAAGHINAESGHGPWPEGLMRLATFLKRL